MSFQTVNKYKRVAVVGLGYVGLSIAAVLAARGADVVGIDAREQVASSVKGGICHINEPGLSDLVLEATRKGNLRATTDIKATAKAEVIIIAVGTPLGFDYEPDLRDLRMVCLSLAPVLQKGQLVIVKSTVSPGTTKNIVAGILAGHSALKPGIDFALACCPERLAEGRILADINALPVIVGGLNPENTRLTAGFWQGYGWETIEVSAPEEAEMSKLADNLWIDVNIALANEIALLCEALGIDALEVINAANTLPKGMHNVNILFPGPGVGGSCLVKDPWFVHNLGRKMGINMLLPSTGRKINEGMPYHVVRMTEEALAGCGKKLGGSTVGVLGLAFKHKTGDMRYSPSIPLIKELNERGAAVFACDPWVDGEEAVKLVDLAPFNYYKNPREVISRADAVVLMVGQPDFLLSPEEWLALAGSKTPIIDCRYVLNQSAMLSMGLSYYSIGRGRRTPGRWEGNLCKEF